MINNFEALKFIRLLMLWLIIFLVPLTVAGGMITGEAPKPVVISHIVSPPKPVVPLAPIPVKSPDMSILS